jgi:hypothetical protein
MSEYVETGDWAMDCELELAAAQERIRALEAALRHRCLSHVLDPECSGCDKAEALCAQPTEAT